MTNSPYVRRHILLNALIVTIDTAAPRSNFKPDVYSLRENTAKNRLVAGE